MAHILIVEDEPDLAELFRKHLAGQGHTCDLASDGQEGRTRVFQAGQDYDLVLCDLEVRPMGGRAFLELVHPVLKDRTPVLVVSAWPDLVEALAVARRWAFLVLDKPVDLQELQDAVERGLEQRGLYQRLLEFEDRVEQLVRRDEVLLERSRTLFNEVRVDPMTQLPNRRRLEEDLDVLCANVGRYRTCFALAFCDLDDFRRFNNEQSYGTGDAVLRAVAQRLRETSRRGDAVYRYGGDEFVIVFAHQDLEEAVQAADRFRGDLDARDLDLGELFGSTGVTISGGVVAVTPEDPRPVVELLDEASRLCKEAKAAGGNDIRPRNRDS